MTLFLQVFEETSQGPRYAVDAGQEVLCTTIGSATQGNTVTYKSKDEEAYQ